MVLVEKILAKIDNKDIMVLHLCALAREVNVKLIETCFKAVLHFHVFSFLLRLTIAPNQAI